MRTRDVRRPLTTSLTARSRWIIFLGLAMGSGTGCGREFYREWANQDVSEAVFEKSRDPRWRIDLFSVEPPAMARHSNPYDPDRPPAPPDDHATEQLSPVPQWPDNRLIVPAEGTGYLDMLDIWQRQQPGFVRPERPESTKNFFGIGRPADLGLPTGPPPSPLAIPGLPPPTPESPSPFIPPAPGANSGTTGAPMTPLPVPGPLPAPPPLTEPPPPPTPAAAVPGGLQTRNRARDLGVTLAAFQQTGLPLPVPPPAAIPPGPVSPPPRDIMPPPIGMDPAPNLEGTDLAAPGNPRPDQTPQQYRAAEAMASELSGILVPGSQNFDEAEAAGLPRSITPYVITMDQAFTLALINARIYQFNLENIYLASLAVTLQRFTFTPQFYAGLNPVTGVAGLAGAGGSFPPPILGDSFTYSTRATGNQTSVLNLGTMAGAGKVLNSGGRILVGFANQLVFNFVGKNSFQPRVQSFLPISFVQPFLRGGGRAVTLEALTQAERNLVYAIRSFVLFRQQFTVATLVGGSVPNFGSALPSLGFTGGSSSDPVVGFINLLEDEMIVENYRRNIAQYEQLVKVYRELIQGESSGLSQLQLNQVESGLYGAKQFLVTSRVTYRNDLDSFKMQMGLPPDTPLIPDRRLTRRFKEVYNAVDNWQRNPNRDLSELPIFPERLPKLTDVVLDGRSLLGVYSEGNNDEEKLEDALLAGERVALEHRLDLMNSRAQLYDAWRQIKFYANALQGVFNVTVTNQFVTPPTNTNPFGFVDQAKQFSLVLNAELPLVRLAERNNFRNALIGYERQRRSLMNNEDSIKNLIREDIRSLQQYYLTYEIQKRNFVLNIRLKDQAFEQIIAPPAGAAGAGASQAPLQTTNLITFQNQLISIENQLVTTWYLYEQQRLELYRDLGTLPYDEWEAFHELFPDEPFGATVGPAAGRDARPPGTASARREPETKEARR